MVTTIRKALITGVAGFASSHLAEELLRRGWKVYGTKRLWDSTENIDHIIDKIEMYLCDVTDVYQVREVINRVRPQAIFHLAAQSFVPVSWKAPQMTMETNVIGTINVLEAARELELPPIILVTSSSQIYGNAEPPFGLNTLFRPMSPYDVSKLAQEMIAQAYQRSYKMRIRITRAFNITGPRRQEFMAESSFAKQIALCEKGLQTDIKVGNLDTTRDYVDIRDVVRGYIDAVDNGEDGGIYILGSGIEHSIKEVLDTLIGFAKVKPNIITDPNLLRPSDTPRMIADTTSAEKIGWKAFIPFEKSLEDLLNFWREKI